MNGLISLSGPFKYLCYGFTAIIICSIRSVWERLKSVNAQEVLNQWTSVWMDQSKICLIPVSLATSRILVAHSVLM